MRRIILIIFSCLIAVSNLIAQEKNITVNTISNYKTTFLEIKADTAKVSMQIKKAFAIRNNYPDSAITILDSALILSKEIDYTDGIARTLNALGLCYIAKAKYDSAIYILNMAIPFCQKAIFYKEILMEVYSNMSMPYTVKGDYTKGLYYLYKAVEEAEMRKITDNYLLSNVYCNLGGQLLTLNENDKAIYYLKKAQYHVLKTNDISNQARILDYIGGAYYQKDELDSALPFFLNAISTSKLSGNTAIQKNVLQNVGKLFIKKHKETEAIGYLRKALDIDSNNKQMTEDNLTIYYDLGSAYYQLKNYKQAEEMLLPAMKIADKTGIKNHMTDGYLTLASIYYNTGKYKQAYEQEKMYSDRYDSILNHENVNQLDEEEVKYKTAEKDKEIAQKQLLITNQQDRLKEKNILIYSIVIVFLLIAVLLFILWKSFRQKQKIEQLRAIMEGEEKERKRIARDLHDGISQTISAAKINLIAIENEIPFESADQKKKFEKIVGLVDSSFREIRTISHNMMPNALLESGLALVIKQFVDDIDSSVIKINLYTQGLEKHFDSSIETILYRVIQECVTNVIKHAQASQLDISLIKDDEGVRVTIEDNGKGFNLNDINAFTGIGLKNIFSRIDFLHGKVEFDSSPDNGTLVSIYVPV